MPDNNLFNPNDLPKKNDDNNTSTNNLNQPIEEHKDLIEIPQAYYDKLAKEEQEKQNKAQAEMLKKQEVLEAKKSFNSFASIVLINAILIFASTYAFLNINELLILLIPSFIVFLTFYFAFKHKKDSTYPISLLIGGIIVAVVTFIISMIKVEELDLWTHYTIVAVVIGYILGVIPFIIPKIFNEREEEQSNKEIEDYYKNQENILNEWLNGKEEVEAQEKGINQEDIFKEYITGQETRKGD